MKIGENVEKAEERNLLKGQAKFLVGQGQNLQERTMSRNFEPTFDRYAFALNGVRQIFVLVAKERSNFFGVLKQRRIFLRRFAPMLNERAMGAMRFRVFSHHRFAKHVETLFESVVLKFEHQKLVNRIFQMLACRLGNVQILLQKLQRDDRL